MDERTDKKISIIFVHYSFNEIKSYIGMNCLCQLKRRIKNNPEIEIIGVNNGERDKETMKEWCDIYFKNDFNSLGRARNLGFDVSSGKYVCFMDNDIYTELPFWDYCIESLEKFPDQKLIASPIYTSHHFNSKYMKGNSEGYMFNKRSGSNCLLMRRETFLDIGRFTETSGGKYNGKDGVEFCNRQIEKGYLMILPRVGLARDVGMVNRLKNLIK